MEERKKLILNTIIQEHIKTGTPVGSSVLVDKYKIKASPATVRNEMSSLEEEGYIIQPHTSAGRIPTEKAYKMYLETINEKKVSSKENEILSDVLGQANEVAYKQVAKVLANQMNVAVFWAFHRHNLYYTGVSNFLQQPEFSQTNLIFDVSAIIDRVDEIINDIFDELKSDVSVYLGSENPFANFCSSIMFKYRHHDNDGLVGIIGPMRMDYEKNLGMMRFISEKLRDNKSTNIN